MGPVSTSLSHFQHLCLFFSVFIYFHILNALCVCLTPGSLPPSTLYCLISMRFEKDIPPWNEEEYSMLWYFFSSPPFFFMLSLWFVRKVTTRPEAGEREWDRQSETERKRQRDEEGVWKGCNRATGCCARTRGVRSKLLWLVQGPFHRLQVVLNIYSPVTSTIVLSTHRKPKPQAECWFSNNDCRQYLSI